MKSLLTAVTILSLSNPAPPADEPILVSTAWLAARLGEPALVLFHIGERAGYDAAHIPGAQFLAPTIEWSTPRVEGRLALELPEPAVLDSALEARGISDHSRIVLYAADGHLTPTSRAYFTLAYAGLGNRVSILDGGFSAWTAEARPVTAEVPRPAPGQLTVRPDTTLVVNAGFLAARLADPAVRIVDARDSSFYRGRETRQGRNGRIPGSANIPFQTITDSTGKFRPVDLLKARFSEAGVTPNQTVITYCHIGQQASLVWLAARLAGLNARLYDGSFQDWARRPELPIESDPRREP